VGVELKEGGEVFRVENEAKNAKFETLSFGGACNVVTYKDFHAKLEDPGSFSIPCMVSRVRIDRAVSDLGESVNLMLYSIF